MIDADELFCRKQQAKPTKPREARCTECRARISTSPTKDIEYGHYSGCSRRPEQFPDNAQIARQSSRVDPAQVVLSDAV